MFSSTHSPVSSSINYKVDVHWVEAGVCMTRRDTNSLHDHSFTTCESLGFAEKV